MNFMKYILNPYYLLRNDVKRAAICSQDVNHSPAIDVSENWLSFIHPIYAMLRKRIGIHVLPQKN